MMIFTPGVAFNHDLVAQVGVLPGIPKDAHSGDICPRLRVCTLPSVRGCSGDIHLFYGDEAASVLSQLTEAGVLSAGQGAAMLARLRDEMEMAEARGIPAHQ